MGNAGIFPLDSSCCIGPNGCIEFGPDEPVRCLLDTFVEGEMCTEGDECVPTEVSRNVPTLNEWGLIAMAGVLGIAAFLIMRRSRATA